MGAPDEISMMLGEMKEQLRAQDGVIGKIAKDVEGLVTSHSDMPEIKALVRKHEARDQRRIGFTAAVSGAVSIAASLIVGLLTGHVK